MKRMIQMLVCCVLATVLVMGSMANAMAQSMFVGQFPLAPQQSQVLQLRPEKPFFLEEFSSSYPGTKLEQSTSLEPKETKVLQLRPEKPFFLAEFFSSYPGTKVVMNAGECGNQFTELPEGRTTQEYKCGSLSSVVFRNLGKSRVIVRVNQE